MDKIGKKGSQDMHSNFKTNLVYFVTYCVFLAAHTICHMTQLTMWQVRRVIPPSKTCGVQRKVVKGEVSGSSFGYKIYLSVYCFWHLDVKKIQQLKWVGGKWLQDLVNLCYNVNLNSDWLCLDPETVFSRVWPREIEWVHCTVFLCAAGET